MADDPHTPQIPPTSQLPPTPQLPQWSDRLVQSTLAAGLALLQSPRLLHWAPWLLAAAAVLGGLAVALATGQVVQVPYPIETMENGMAEMAVRAAAGLPMYAEPSLDYIAMPYGPLGPRVASWLLGGSVAPLQAMRAVNAGGMAVAVVVVYLLARTWQLPRPLALVAAAWPLLAGEMTGNFFGVGKSDGLMVALMLGGMLAVARGRGVLSALLAGTLFGLACAVKQSALPYAMVLATVLALVEWRRAAVLLASTAAVAWLLVGLPVLQGDRWMGYFLYEAPSEYPHAVGSPLVMPRALLARDVGMVALALAAPPWLWLLGERRRAVHALAVLLAGLVPSLLLLTQGTYSNSLIPATAVLGVVAMLAVQQWVVALTRRGAPGGQLGLLWAAIGLQLLAMIHNPFKVVPGPAARAEWQALVDWVRAAPAPVALPDEPYTARLSGQRFFATDACLTVLSGAPKTGRPMADRIRGELLAWIDAQRPAAVVTTFHRDAMSERAGYAYVGALNGPGGWDRTVGGYTQQWHVFVRRDLPATASPAPVLNRLVAGEVVGWPLPKKAAP
ncbi:MAG: DUF2029 domain-containing protein [Deltaproteobacteria bacterium]|nr:DUF2029 domain-containing protein [Deltaproteobacteria bacterium]